jgi:hypothetical protein
MRNQNEAFTHKVTRDMIERGMMLSPTQKLQWAVHGKKVCVPVFSPEKLKRWQEKQDRQHHEVRKHPMGL